MQFTEDVPSLQCSSRCVFPTLETDSTPLKGVGNRETGIIGVSNFIKSNLKYIWVVVPFNNNSTYDLQSCGNTNLFKADVSGDTNSPCNHWWDPQKATGEPVISLPWIKAAFFTSRNIDGCRVWSFFFQVFPWKTSPK